MLVVPLKLWCRKQVGGWGNIGLDDYLMIVAAIIDNALFWLTVVGKILDMNLKHGWTQ